MDRFNGFLRKESAKKGFDVTVKPVAESTMKGQCRQWKPITLHRPFLFGVILVALGLLALIQFLVVYDQHHDGILFASNISELGTGRIFLYRYFPTILAVSYGLFWHWIDVDTRRIEPYRQLSKPGGATGKDSLHLHYPTDLLAFVPLNALKRRHWPVVISSSALVLIGMGLTPLQAAMFATESVVKTFAEPMEVSTQHLSIADQAAQITANYTYSVANIVWLDERLPPYMSRDAAFMPFKLVGEHEAQDNETWTAETTSFGVDLKCEPAIENDEGKAWTSSQGCEVDQPFGLDGTDVVGINNLGDDINEYSPFFAGYAGDGGNTNYYLSSSCPNEASNVFMVALQKNKRSADEPLARTTRLFCETTYYQQVVTATVRQADGHVSEVVNRGSKTPLPSTMFNTSIFEAQISNARQQQQLRGAIPDAAWPDQKPQLAKLPITLSPSYPEMSNVFGLAVGALPRADFGDYMDAQVLAESFQAAYRLLFARAMVDVLATNYEDVASSSGTRVYAIEAIRIVPHFAYAVEAVLGIAAMMAFALMAVSWSDAINLATDPDSMSALMLLIKGQSGLLEQFSPHDQSSWARLEATTSDSTYALVPPFSTDEGTLGLKELSHKAIASRSSCLEEDKPDFRYPLEFSLKFGALFMIGLTAALASTSYLYHASRVHGLALPTENRFVRQILENYIPTIIATLIEPVWNVLNRLICLFQPLQELYGRRVTAQRSIDLKYSSLPPQFVLFKALGAKHFILSAICAMALLANVLAVAFSGLLDEDTIAVAHSTGATSLHDARVTSQIQNASVSSNPFPFYHVMANYTSGTPMPSWTDAFGFYPPISHEAQLNESDRLQINNISAVMADVRCDLLSLDQESSWDFSGFQYGTRDPMTGMRRKANLTVSVLDDGGDEFSCSSNDILMYHDFDAWPCSSQQVMAFEYLASLAMNASAEPVDDDPCQGLFVGLWARKPASSMCGEGKFTLSDDEATVMVCKPTVMVQSANVTLTGDHHVLEAQRNGTPYEFPGSERLISEFTNALWEVSTFRLPEWHNDTFPSNWQSYVMDLIDPDAGVLNPASPVPDFDGTANLFTKAFQQVFAVWLSMEHVRLLAPAAEDSPVLSATILRPEIRIVVSRPMTILSATILGLYIIIAVAVYMHRPGRFLPRMPLTIASDIALFAASKAVSENTPTDKSRQDLGAERERFGYGSFIGTDGKPHVGIEKAPFVVPI